MISTIDYILRDFKNDALTLNDARDRIIQELQATKRTDELVAQVEAEAVEPEEVKTVKKTRKG